MKGWPDDYINSKLPDEEKDKLRAVLNGFKERQGVFINPYDDIHTSHLCTSMMNTVLEMSSSTGPVERRKTGAYPPAVVNAIMKASDERKKDAAMARSQGENVPPTAPAFNLAKSEDGFLTV